MRLLCVHTYVNPDAHTLTSVRLHACAFALVCMFRIMYVCTGTRVSRVNVFACIMQIMMAKASLLQQSFGAQGGEWGEGADFQALSEIEAIYQTVLVQHVYERVGVFLHT